MHLVLDTCIDVFTKVANATVAPRTRDSECRAVIGAFFSRNVSGTIWWLIGVTSPLGLDEYDWLVYYQGASITSSHMLQPFTMSTV